jgi:tetratricopeptide (TPR) repeat protein
MVSEALWLFFLILMNNKDVDYKWLMVFDNVGDINFVKPCFPSSIGSILLTTRSYGVIDSVRGPAAALQLGRLSEEDSQSVFINQLKMNPRRPEWNEPDKVSAAEREAMHWLLQKLDGLPLGIRQCAALIRVKNCSVSKFVTRYERLSGNTEKLVSSSNSSFTIDQSYNFVLHTVWAMSFNMLADSENRRAFRLLGCLSMISPDVIHSDLFCQSFNDDPDPEFLKSSNSEDDDNEELSVQLFNLQLLWLSDFRFERAKDELAEAALIDVEDDTISMHRLVQNSFLHFMSDVDLQSSLGEVSSALNNAFPKRRPTKRLLDHWPRCAKYCQHAIALADCFHALRSRLTSTPDFLELISNCCWYLYELGEKADCNRIAEIARSACSDKRSLVYSHIVNTLGTSLFELNKMRKCREYLEEALRVRKSLMTDDKEHVLCTLSNLGNLEASEGHYERALELYMEAKNEREQTEKEPSISLAFIYMGIGRSYRGIRNFKAAVRYFQKAETVFLKHHGPRGQFAVA